MIKKVVCKIDGLAYSVLDEVEGITTDSVELIIKDDESIHIIYNIEPITEAPVMKDEIIGKALIYIDDQLYSSVDIKSTRTANRIDYHYCVRYVVNSFISFLEERNESAFTEIF